MPGMCWCKVIPGMEGGMEVGYLILCMCHFSLASITGRVDECFH